ncbi:hypothetical protein EC968_007209 [Mortierella alpina]|nr:hypothetical protein EC968_007209 [Mortierella alpina]
MGKAEFFFFGKHFGYGNDYTVAKDESQDRLEGRTRKAQLQQLRLNARGLKPTPCDIVHWTNARDLNFIWKRHTGDSLVEGRDEITRGNQKFQTAHRVRLLAPQCISIANQKSMLPTAENSDPKSSMLPASPFDVPEIASLIASYLSNSDLAQCARVSRSLHDICIPILWKSIHFNNLFFRRDRDFDKESYRVDLIRHGKLSLIKELTIAYHVADDDMEMIAEHCSRLKALNFDCAQVTAKTLALLGDHGQTQDLDPDDRSKRRKTRLPIHLESLIFKAGWGRPSLPCFSIIPLLGPQLKRLHLSHFHDTKDQKLIEVIRHCPNLVGLRLNFTSLTSGFFMAMALEFPPSDCTSTNRRYRQRLEDLNLDSNEKLSNAESEGVSAVVKACRSTLKTLSVQDVRGVNNKLLIALFKGPDSENATGSPKIAQNLTTQANALKHASDKIPILHHGFSPNTVLTEIRLSRSYGLAGEGLEILFRYATELASIHLDGRMVNEGTLMVLAETYRNRMKALGLGVPAAWREHVLADERVRAISREGAAAGGHQAITTAANDATEESSASSDNVVKVFTGWHVPGGLKRLSLRDGGTILTNKGVRAILRSCVGLECLDIGNCSRLTLELFQGPWACLRLKDLDISGMALESVSRDLEVFAADIPDSGPDPFSTTRAASCEEELAESLRFPCANSPYPEGDDFNETGGYDYMAIPGDEYYDYPTKPWNIDNTPRRRAILRQFYSKLGQLRQLRTLNMNDSKFRVRVKDGLELVLPGLQQNLIRWKLGLENGYYLGSSELEFFGKNFGYGDDFTASEDNDQDCLEGKIRQAKLEHLYLVEDSLQDVRREVQEWASDQGFDLEIDDFGRREARRERLEYLREQRQHAREQEYW